MGFKKVTRGLVLGFSLLCIGVLLGNHPTALAEEQYNISQVLINGKQYAPGAINLGPVQNLNFTFGFSVNRSLSGGNYRARILIDDIQSGSPEKTINITGSSVDFGQIPLSKGSSSYQISLSLLQQDGETSTVIDSVSFPLQVGAVDTTSPKVQSIVPLGGSFALPVDTKPMIIINELIQEGTATASTVYLKEKAGGAKVNASLVFNTEDNKTVITLIPSGNLKYGLAYTVEIPEGGIKDLAGNGITGFSSEFTTLADPNAAPILLSRNPSVNATNVNIATTINLGVSKELDLNSVSASSIYLQKGSSKVPVTMIVRNLNGQGQITMTPASNLDYNSTYTVVVVANRVKDLNGKYLAGSSWNFTTQNSPITMISSRYPGEGSTNVPVDTNITLWFSSPLNASTITNSNIYLRRSGYSGNIPATVSYNSSSRAVTITPSAQLLYDTEYRVYVSGNVKDSAGRALSATNWIFTTMKNDLRIIDRTPDAGATNVPVNTEIRIRFSTNMRSATINSSNIYLRRSGYSSNIAATISYDSSTRTAILKPNSDLDYDRSYVVYLTSGVQDSNYNPLSATNWGFSTAPEDYVRITSRSPGVNATNVAVNTPITIGFSRAMNSATINSNTVYLCPAGSSSKVSASVSYNSSARTVTLTPTSRLQYNTQYIVYVDGVRDYQNYYLSRTDWRFTTASLLLPAVTSSDPASNQSSVSVNKALTVRFNRAMDKNTVSSSTVYLRNLKTGGTVSANIYYDQYNHTVTVIPTGRLDYNTGYVLYLNGVKDSEGNLMGITTITFTTEAESIRKGTPSSPLVKVNGQYVTFTDVRPYLKNDRIFIPFRALAETIDAKVGYDNSNPDKMRVWAILGSNKIELTVGEKIAYRNGRVLVMDVAPELKDNRTMIPLRFAVEALDKKVSWDEQNYTALLVD